MQPETTDRSYPLFNKVSLPRMIISQFDSLNVQQLLKPLQKMILKELEAMLVSKDPQLWFTAYVSIFILLHETSVTSADRYRHARANALRERYSLPGFVEELQQGANVLLYHWHYYRRKVDPSLLTGRDRQKTMLKAMTEEEFGFIQKSWLDMKSKGKNRPL